MTFLLLLILVVLMIARNGGYGLIVVGFTWLAAATFNPNVDSGFIWALGFALGYLADLSDD